MDTPARIYYKYEGGSPSGSHKPNTAVAQAYYNKEVGVTRLATETGAGQWGSALSFACQVFGIECKVYMVRVSYEQKPYRKVLMQTWGKEVVPSPSPDTNAGRRILARQPGQHRQPRYCHIGGGGRCRHARRAAGLIEAVNVQQRAIFDRRLRLRVGSTPMISAIRRRHRWMHTLGHDFVPAPIHAGGLLSRHERQVSALNAAAVNVQQRAIFEAARSFGSDAGGVGLQRKR